MLGGRVGFDFNHTEKILKSYTGFRESALGVEVPREMMGREGGWVSQQLFSAAFLSSSSQQPFSAALLSSSSQQLFSAAFLSSLSQQPFSAALLSSLSQQPFSAALLSSSSSAALSQQPFSAALLSSLSQQLFSAALLSSSSQQPFSAAFLSSSSQQPFSAALLSSSSQQPFSAALLSSLSQQPFSAAFLSSPSQQPFSAAFLSSLSQQLFSAALPQQPFLSSLSQQLFSAAFLSSFSQQLFSAALLSSFSQQLFSAASSAIFLLWSRVGGQLLTSSSCGQGLVGWWSTMNTFFERTLSQRFREKSADCDLWPFSTTFRFTAPASDFEATRKNTRKHIWFLKQILQRKKSWQSAFAIFHKLQIYRACECFWNHTQKYVEKHMIFERNLTSWKCCQREKNSWLTAFAIFHKLQIYCARQYFWSYTHLTWQNNWFLTEIEHPKKFKIFVLPQRMLLWHSEWFLLWHHSRCDRADEKKIRARTRFCYKTQLAKIRVSLQRKPHF